MRKKIVTVLFAVVLTVSFIFGGCGELQETGGRAKRTEQTRETEEPGASEETRESDESREMRSDADNAGNETSEILELLDEDEPERLVRPDNLNLQNFLKTGTIEQGYVIVSDMRFFFCGTSYDISDGAIIQLKQSQVVDLQDITGVGFDSEVDKSWIPFGTISFLIELAIICIPLLFIR